jgi:hypothetical protein
MVISILGVADGLASRLGLKPLYTYVLLCAICSCRWIGFPPGIETAIKHMNKRIQPYVADGLASRLGLKQVRQPRDTIQSHRCRWISFPPGIPVKVVSYYRLYMYRLSCFVLRPSLIALETEIQKERSRMHLHVADGLASRLGFL